MEHENLQLTIPKKRFQLLFVPRAQTMLATGL